MWFDTSKWDEERTTIPTTLAPGREVDFAYHAEVRVGARIDHAEIIYEDASGNEYVLSDRVTVPVPRNGADCGS